MPLPRRSRPAPRRPARRLAAALALVGSLAPAVLSIRAHERLQSILTQDFELTAGVTNLDVSLVLTFQEGPSFAERRLMDANRDGRIEPSEIRQYLRQRLPELEDGLRLAIQTSPDQAPTPLPLSLLHQPELDLRGHPVAGLASHTLQIRWFARTPGTIPAGSRLLLTPDLWPHLPSTRTVHASGSPAPGLAVRVADPTDRPAPGPPEPSGARTGNRTEPMVFLCLPAAGPTSPASP